MGLKFQSQSDVSEVIAYCDSDHAGDLTDRKSTSGHVIIYGGAPVTWSSKKQSVVALHSTEAEFIAASECCKDLKFVKSFIKELLDIEVSIKLHMDNQSAIKWIKSGKSCMKNKHIDVRFHFMSSECKNLFNVM